MNMYCFYKNLKKIKPCGIDIEMYVFSLQWLVALPCAGEVSAEQLGTLF